MIHRPWVPLTSHSPKLSEQPLSVEPERPPAAGHLGLECLEPAPLIVKNLESIKKKRFSIIPPPSDDHFCFTVVIYFHRFFLLWWRAGWMRSVLAGFSLVLGEVTHLMDTLLCARHWASTEQSPCPSSSTCQKCLSLPLKRRRSLRMLSDLFKEQIKGQSQDLNPFLSDSNTFAHSTPSTI